jgi:hypothetical protein
MESTSEHTSLDPVIALIVDEILASGHSMRVRADMTKPTHPAYVVRTTVDGTQLRFIVSPLDNRMVADLRVSIPDSKSGGSQLKGWRQLAKVGYDDFDGIQNEVRAILASTEDEAA